MTDYGVPDHDMPTFPWSIQAEAGAFDTLLAGNCRPEEAPAELRPVAEVLVALQAPPDRREVAGWGGALTVYREMAGRPGTPGRSRSRRPTISLEALPDLALADLPGLRSPDAADLALENLATRAAMRVIARLPPLQAEVIMLRVAAGLDTETVGLLLGRTPGAIRIAAHRGLHRLASLLAEAGVTQ